MVTERSDRQFAGLDNSWLDDLFANLLNPEMQFFVYIKSEYFPFAYLGSGAVEFDDWVS